MAKKVTVRDVAAAAGVSVSTASRVLSGVTTVNPDMARRVLRASQSLGYTANPLARALRTRRTDSVGMVVPSISNSYFVSAVEAVEQALAEQGRSLILCDARESVATEAERLEVLVQRMVDGLVVVPVTAQDSVPALAAAAEQVPVVLFDRWADCPRTDFVGTDNREGMRQIVQHLRSLGVEEVVYVGAEPLTSTADERLSAFRDLVGVRARTLLGTFTAEWGERAARELLAGGRLPGAVVCGADVIAFALQSTLQNSGVRVPEDVRVASFDGSVLSQLSVPRITSVRQPVETMAAEAVRLLEARREQRERPASKAVFAPALLVGASTAT